MADGAPRQLGTRERPRSRRSVARRAVKSPPPDLSEGRASPPLPPPPHRERGGEVEREWGRSGEAERRGEAERSRERR
jgi:hypothetical protein